MQYLPLIFTLVWITKQLATCYRFITDIIRRAHFEYGFLIHSIPCYLLVLAGFLSMLH